MSAVHDRERELVLVTGSSGLIGKAVIERLAPRYRVVGMARRGGQGAGDFISLDVTSDDSLRSALYEVRSRHGTSIASVIHLAAFYDFSGKPSPLYRQVTVDGTRRLLAGLRDFEVGQFWFSSTMLVQEPSPVPGEPIDELDALDPAWDYPRSKVATERLIARERGTMPAVFGRIAGVYDEWCHSVPIAHQIQRIAERALTAYVFPGDPTHGQAFLHLADLVDAIERSITDRDRLPDEFVVLLGERQAVSYGSLQDVIGSRLYGGAGWPTVRIPKPFAALGAWAQDLVGEPFIKPWMIEFADEQYELDVDRACQRLGWEPRRTLREMIPIIVENFLSDPRRWYRENKLDPAAVPEEWLRSAAPSS